MVSHTLRSICLPLHACGFKVLFKLVHYIDLACDLCCEIPALSFSALLELGYSLAAFLVE